MLRSVQIYEILQRFSFANLKNSPVTNETRKIVLEQRVHKSTNSAQKPTRTYFRSIIEYLTNGNGAKSYQRPLLHTLHHQLPATVNGIAYTDASDFSLSNFFPPPRFFFFDYLARAERVWKRNDKRWMDVGRIQRTIYARACVNLSRTDDILSVSGCNGR